MREIDLYRENRITGHRARRTHTYFYVRRAISHANRRSEAYDREALGFVESRDSSCRVFMAANRGVPFIVLVGKFYFPGGNWHFDAFLSANAESICPSLPHSLLFVALVVNLISRRHDTME